jgi:zinc transport system ATP-binding protein
MSVLEVKSLRKRFGDVEVLRGIDLKLERGEVLSIIGSSGGGKTTLVKCILGLHHPDEGRIRCFREGREVSKLAIGYLPQYNTIDKKFPISVYEVILSGLSGQKSLFRGYSAEQHEQVHETLVRMGLEGLEDRPIGQLSGGQLQRALLGRALVSNPEVLILDEPNTYIDKQFETKLYSLLEEINRECAIVLISHDIGTILQNVKSVACVNGTLDYHPDTEVSPEWLGEHFGCPIELVGHGHLPHRVLKNHSHK